MLLMYLVPGIFCCDSYCNTGTAKSEIDSIIQIISHKFKRYKNLKYLL